MTARQPSADSSDASGLEKQQQPDDRPVSVVFIGGRFDRVLKRQFQKEIVKLHAQLRNAFGILRES